MALDGTDSQKLGGSLGNSPQKLKKKLTIGETLYL
jgi:hypothetical protein